MKQNDVLEEIFIKVGPRELNFKPNSAIEKMFIELVADYVNKRFTEIQKEQVDTMKTYAYALLEIAKEKIGLEKKVEEKINNLELRISSLVEKIDSSLKQ
ncbi:MAG: hypothetical protein ACK4WJ_04315 [Endomicrobiia bacterium]